ncbi:ABC transporter ATP-binding protein [Phytohabitans houttuyneae]|uniref:Multidrug ABC transporter permease n=1 Tax=Phytohabitans houttuyneae TaxID=1076126 RepID=A0A6V8K8H8_9ACTN|nr:ATP-binding cassette domain-containing protein [Phytohabitans houttuyneae]GFJ78057.1 multidrug ABC transporter permease [Phytohabitans houttuyneae]
MTGGRVRSGLRSWVFARRADWSARASLLRLLVAEGRWLVSVVAATRVVTALLPTLAAASAAYVVRTLGQPAGAIHLLVAACGVGGVVVLTQTVYALGGTVDYLVIRRVDGAVRRRVRVVALGPPGIGHLESPRFQDDACRATDDGRGLGRSGSPGAAAIGQLALMSRSAGAVIAAVALAAIAVVPAVLLLAVAVVVGARIRRQWMSLASAKDAAAADRRRVGYWTGLAEEKAAKEVLLFGLGPWIHGRWRVWSARSNTPQWRVATRVVRQQWTSAVLVVAAAAVAWGVLGSGSFTTAEIAMGLLLIWGIFTLTEHGEEMFDVEYGTRAAQALARLESGSGGAATAERSARPPATAPTIRFESVSFSYPGDPDRPVLKDLTLTLHAGETVALVGRNGTGKTTLVRLLAGLYQPTAGRITVDGVDLAELDLAAWRSSVAAVFQEHVRYPASAGDNVALAAPEALADREGVVAALRKAGADEALPAGLDGSLWREGSAGTDLSGGQWQRIAVARALFAVAHGRRVLVLDEPTANLDVRAEATFHESIVSAVDGATVLLISHRLSTVRPADRIVLLRDGRIVEQGGHRELMARDSEYRRLYLLQARRFEEAGTHQTS